MSRLPLPLLLLAAAVACDMSDQPRYDSYEPSRLFPDGTSMQAPPEGTLAQDAPARAAALLERPPLTAELLARGRERYGIFCTPCHGLAGDGDGAVVARGFPRPPAYAEERLRRAPSSYFVTVITEGHGVMYPYADRVAPADRWAIAGYIRALQLSQRAPVAQLPAGDRTRLAGAAQ
jgi:mono/diheme cytochrome c family protein